jgi:hypothetical protein
MLRGLSLFCLVAALGATAQAGTIGLALDMVVLNYTYEDIYGGSVGWSFLVNSPIVVDSLDFYDDYGNGLTQAHDVGIYDSSQDLLVWGTVLPTDPLTGTAPWREHAVTATLLIPGTYYIVAVTGSEHYAQWAGSPGPPALGSVVTIPQITYLSDQYNASPFLAFPSDYDGNGNAGYADFGPSFGASDVPEPARIGLLAAGLGLVCAARRRPRQA